MKRLTLLYFFLYSYCVAQYTNPIASQVNTKIVEADEFHGEDMLGFNYLIKNNTLFKVKNTENFQYKNPLLGKITRVDFQNPLRILLFYENFNTVVALDRQLNELQVISFTENNSNLIAHAAGTAGQNNYWIFDQMTQQLFLYQYTSNITKTIGLPFTNGFKNYATDFNFFYWIDQDNNLNQCDIFGHKTILTTLPEFDLISFSGESFLVFSKNDLLFLFDISKKATYPIQNVKNSFKSFTYKNQNLAIFTNEGITNYKINLP